jgi:haloacetate dehalogenase
MSSLELFPGFKERRTTAPGGGIHCVIGGNGPPLLMLHGYPQTHVMWHKIAPTLAKTYTVVCADLRGYGDSFKPRGDETHAAYSKRSMAGDMVALMRELGFPRFRLCGHDRGGRVSHRLCLDHPDAVERVAFLDLCPTRIVFANLSQGFATAYYHWFFLIQPYDFPERMIGADPLYFVNRKLGSFGSDTTSYFDPRAMAQYRRCFQNPDLIHATCEDYRAAASIDLAHDTADQDTKVRCPVLVLWGDKGVVHKYFEPLRDWGSVATNVRGKALPAGHFIAEEAPAETLAELAPFFAE